MSLSDMVWIIVLVGSARFFFAHERAPYIGYGWSLGWRDGKIIVLSRLLESPSGRARVSIGSVLLRYEDVEMDFANGEQFISFIRSRGRPKLGQIEFFTLKTGHEIREIALRAELIVGSIPIYAIPSPLSPSEEAHYRHGMFWCGRTGQLVFTRSLSDESLHSLLGGSD